MHFCAAKFVLALQVPNNPDWRDYYYWLLAIKQNLSVQLAMVADGKLIQIYERYSNAADT